MTWEIERHEWSKFRRDRNDTDVPYAFGRLLGATSEREAMYARSDVENIMGGQGILAEIALPMCSCLVSFVPHSSRPARVEVLRLISMCLNGNASRTEVALGNRDIDKACLHEILRGVTAIFDVLEDGNDTEAVFALDIIGFCASADPLLASKFRWYLGRLKERAQSKPVLDEIAVWMVHFGKS